MVNKITKLIALLIIMSNLASCQNKSQSIEISNSQGFCIQDSLTYYNGKRFNIVGSVNDFISIVGKPDRTVIDSSGGNVNRSWQWKSKSYRAFNDGKMIVMRLKDSQYEEYKTIDEIIKKYGKFDEYKEDKQPLDVRKYYIWDKLGIELFVTKNEEINCIYLHTLHYSKTKLISKEELENPDLIYNTAPKQEYKGMFTYNGHTIDFGKMSYDNWFKTVKDLNIEGESYDPPGDSKQWSRVISERNLSVEMIRESNELGSTDGFHVSEIGVVNAVKYIQISN